jgi:hypothetical protein
LRITTGSHHPAHWALVPSGFGREQVRPLAEDSKVVRGTTRTYDHRQLSVAYSKTATGFEQRFTIDRRPGGANRPVVIAMASSGDMTPILNGPTTVTLRGNKDLSNVTYSGLRVTDATGKVLPAHLVASGQSIHIVIDDRGATYPVLVDPWIQLASLIQPANAGVFGTAVATSASGTVAIVGDPLGGTTTTGAATVYAYSSGSWTAVANLTPPSGASQFGTSVAMAGNGETALVGDPYNGSNGAATVYTSNGTTWNTTGVSLTYPASAAFFGTSVALSSNGDTALVGDPENALPLIRGQIGPGAATVFTYNGTSWATSTGTPLSVPTVARAFGASVALSADGLTALVGDPTGGQATHGAAYAYAYNGASWVQGLALTLPAKSFAFGTSLALWTNGTSATALVGDPAGGASGTGAATIDTSTNSGASWVISATLAPPSGAGTFGTSVALTSSGTGALVGDPGGGGGTGASTVYSSTGVTWSTGTSLLPPPGAFSFGTAVALSAASALVGDPAGGTNEVGAVTVYSSSGSNWNLGVAASQPALDPSEFGTSVAVSTDGSTVVVGDPGGGSTANGSATVYTYNGRSLTGGTNLTPPSGYGEFGASVAVSSNGTTVLVGDPGGNSFISGAATVYTFSNGSWSTGTPLAPPDTAGGFGASVALSSNGTTAIVGDPQGGGPLGSDPGAATIFTLSSGSWSAGTPLTPPVNTVDQSLCFGFTSVCFGTSVALSGNGSTAIVGFPIDNSTGSVTAYVASDGSWSGGTALSVPSGASAFGTSVALSLSGSTAIVGDPTGGGSNKGGADVFSFNGLAWSSGTSLATPAGAADFGTSVSLSSSGTTALVGDPQVPAGSFATGPGEATVYNYQGPGWFPGVALTPPANSGQFGTSVGLSGDGLTAVVGDPLGNEDSDGAATVFSFDSTLAPSTVTASATPTFSTSGDSVTYGATVAPTSGSGSPTGTVSFTVGLTTLCTATLASGSGHCSVTDTPIGIGFVFAHYSGDSTYAASIGSAPVTVGLPSTTAVSVNPTVTSFSQPVTYSATVNGGGTPTGSVTFTIGGTTLCTTAPLVSGSGSCVASTAPAGSDTVTGTYSGDGTFAGSDGSAPLTVAQAPTTTTISVSPASTTSGSPVTYTATSVHSEGGNPSGTVTFSVGGTILCTTSGPLSSGLASCVASNAPVGTDTVIGTYPGSEDFSASLGTAQLIVNLPNSTSSSGYDLVGSDGGVFVFGTPGQGFFGSLPGLGVKVNNIVGIVPTSTDEGYFLVGSDGGVFAFGNAPFENSLPGLGVKVNNIVGIVPTADDQGYFLVGSDGGVFAFGNAPFENSLPGLGVHVNNIVGIVPTADDGGYWLVSANGAVYALGDAPFVGSLGGNSPTPIVGIAATHDSGGYWLVGQNGSVFPFGDASSFGSLPALGVSVSNIVAVVPTPDGQGYWLIGSDGGIFAFGDATEIGSLPGLGVSVNNIVGAVPTA